MSNLFRNRFLLCLLALALGILSTLFLDLWVVGDDQLSGPLEWAAYWLTLVLRAFSYVALFFSCRLLAEKQSASSRRALHLALVWSLVGILLAAFVWLQFTDPANVYDTPAIERFTPDTLAGFAPGWTMAEVAMGKEHAKNYTWLSAISLEFFAIVACSFLTSFFLMWLGRSGWLKLGYLAPVFAMLIFGVYAFLVGWSFDWDFDFFIGDAIIGAMIFNAIFIWWTIQYGGFTAPAVWVGLIAISNFVCLRIWDKSDTTEI